MTLIFYKMYQHHDDNNAVGRKEVGTIGTDPFLFRQPSPSSTIITIVDNYIYKKILLAM